MNILIIGGTKFVGRHLIDAVLGRGHSVTIFNRGRFSSETFAGVEIIRGDRNRDLDRLGDRTWDVVIDTCGYLPGSVRQSAEYLKDRTDLYVFISSVSVYADFFQLNIDETAQLAELTPEQTDLLDKFDADGEVTAVALAELYGGAKAACERVVEAAFPDRSLIVRPGLIVGPLDTTDRFTYWVARIAAGGDVLAPGTPDRNIQIIDARDLVDWTIRMVERRANGIFNATSRPFDLTNRQMVEDISAVANADAHLVWVSEDFLAKEMVRPWSEMPLYLPESNQDTRGFLSINTDRAIEAGLEFRPLSVTIADILEWNGNRDAELKAGISREREAELLQKWAKVRGELSAE